MNNHDVAHWGHSLKYLKWDDKKTLTASQKLISRTVHEWYDAKHPAVSHEELKMVNGLTIDHCPICGSAEIIKYGCYKDGTHCYKCLSCNHKFSPLTNTIFYDRKIPISEWIEYLLYLFEFHSITTAARDNRNATSTGRYWLFKVFAVLKEIQNNVVLEGDVYIDEMYFSVIKEKVVEKDGKKLRGISRNKIGVAAGYDNHRHIVLIVENTSKPSIRSTWKALGTHIKPGSTLIHDGDNSHSVLISRLNLIEKKYTTSETKGLDDKDNPLDPINNLHSLAKKYMRAHGGYDRDNLQDWMNLISFILSEPDDRYEKVDRFIKLAIVSPQKVKYRDVMGNKVVK
ncbi:MAG: hypothetical protein LKF79_05445 [Solobacterium sp.]|jgi:transposase-like protein|nr:hypothetical protein [Solobacterium sp.]MCH4266068.1 hypothetical protein [Solobacterium sp.]